MAAGETYFVAGRFITDPVVEVSHLRDNTAEAFSLSWVIAILRNLLTLFEVEKHLVASAVQ